VPRRYHLFRVLVAQLVEAESAPFGNARRFIEEFCGIEARQLRQAAQVLLGVGQAPTPEFTDAAAVAQCGHDVVQGAAAGAVHLHVAAGHQWQMQGATQLLQRSVAAQFVVAQVIVHADPHPVATQA
jgi:hypothetical protein